MGDSNLHIVQREDGQFEVVKLAPVNKKISHSKIETFVNSEGGSGSRKGTCTKELQLRIPNEAKEKTEAPRFPGLKTYSRARIKEVRDPTGNVIKIKRILIHKNTVSSATTATNAVTVDSSSAMTKYESEIDILDDPEAAKKSVENEKLLSTGHETVVDEQSIKTIQNVSPVTNINLTDPDGLGLEKEPLLQELAKKNMKCNICGLIFSKSDNQLNTLRIHFLKHKTAVMMKTVKECPGVKYQFDCLDKQAKRLRKRSNESSAKKPVILNGQLGYLSHQLLKKVTVVKTYSPVNRGQKTVNSQIQIDPDRNRKKILIDKKLPNILRRTKVINVKPISRSLLDKLQSIQSSTDEKNIGKSHLIIGSTSIKPVKQSNVIASSSEIMPANESMETSETKGPDEGVTSDADDDIEIVEQQPELIVIEDNDEVDQS